MNIPESGIARRDFLRITGAAGLGLCCGLQRSVAGASLPGSAAAGAKAAIMHRGHILVGLDIGSSKVRAVVGETRPDGTIAVLGVGQAPSLGIRSGEVVDSEAAVKCVREALIDAEQKTDVMIGSVRLAVLPRDTERLGTRINEYIGCVHKIGVEVDDVTLRPLASAEAVLDPEQTKLGALVIDMGAGTTSYIAFAGGGIKGWGVANTGGDDVTNDVALRMGIPYADAEKLKQDFGRVWLGPPLGKHSVAYPAQGVGHEEFEIVMRSKVRDIFERIKNNLAIKGIRLDPASATVHLTGGGSKLRGIECLSDEVFGMPTFREGAKGIVWAARDRASPEHSCAIGLLKIGAIGSESRPFHPEAPRRRYIYIIPSRAA